MRNNWCIFLFYISLRKNFESGNTCLQLCAIIKDYNLLTNFSIKRINEVSCWKHSTLCMVLAAI